MRTWNKGSTTGKVFSVDLLDKQGGEIRASFFNQGADMWTDKLNVGGCYTFSKGGVKIANRQYNSCNHRYELTFDKEAQITEIADDQEIQTMKALSIVDLCTVQKRALPCTVDLCGIITSFQPTFKFTSRDGKELVKREITLVDDTALSMIVTLWGDRANMPDEKFQGQPAVALKEVLVKEWNNGRSGSLLQDGHLLFDSKEPAVQKVMQWWASGGASQTVTALSVAGGGGGSLAKNAKDMNFSEVRSASEKLSDQQEIYRVVGRLAIVQTKRRGENQPFTYVKEDTNGLLGNQITKSVVKMNLRCRFVDFEDSMWLTTFHEAAQQVAGVSAEEAHILEKEGEAGREQLENKLKSRYFTIPWQLTIRAKLDAFNGEPRPNVTCFDAKPVNRGEHGRKMLAEIREMLAMPMA